MTNITQLLNEANELVPRISFEDASAIMNDPNTCLLYTSPSPRDRTRSRMPSSA